jgi:hypothetical protein
MSKARIKVRSKDEIDRTLRCVLSSNVGDVKVLRKLCYNVLDECNKKEIEPEVLLYELYGLVARGEEVLAKKHQFLMSNGIEGDLSWKEKERLEKDFCRTLKAIQVRKAVDLEQRSSDQKDAPSPKKDKPKEQDQLMTENGPYMMSKERPPYVA